MSFTKKNLSEVKDSAAEFGIGEIQEARFADGELDAQDTGFSHHVIRPGKRQGFGHVHDKAEEVYVVIAGSGRIKLDDEVVDLERLDAIRISPEVTRALEAADDGLEYLAFGPKHKGDGNLDQEFWPAD